MRQNLGWSGNNDMDHVASVSHDLKSPLNALIGFIELIKLDIKGCNVPADVMQHLNILGDVSNDMLALINNMITSVRIEAGQEPVAPVLLGRQELQMRAEALGKTFANEAKSRRVDFSVNVHSLPEFVYWDILKVRYFAVNNIISNALKFVGEGGTVNVDITTTEAGIVEIAVSDNGPGISLDERSRFFEKFNPSSRNERSFYGNGFGLSNAAHIIKAHHGSIAIQDGLNNRGVTFIIKIPPIPFEIKELELRQEINQAMIKYDSGEVHSRQDTRHASQT
jgi:two-component system sensor histidine kinase ResE